MARSHKRDALKEIKGIISKAKSAMYSWVVGLGYEPTEEEAKAWQAGYLAGLSHRENV